MASPRGGGHGPDTALRAPLGAFQSRGNRSHITGRAAALRGGEGAVEDRGRGKGGGGMKGGCADGEGPVMGRRRWGSARTVGIAGVGFECAFRCKAWCAKTPHVVFAKSW